MIFFTYLCSKNEYFMLKIECEDIELSDLILRGRCTTNRLYKKLSSNAFFKTDLAKVFLFTEHEEGLVIKLITISEHYGDK